MTGICKGEELPAESEVEKIRAALQAAYEEGQSKLKGNGKSVPALSALKIPLRDDDTERPDSNRFSFSMLRRYEKICIIALSKQLND